MNNLIDTIIDIGSLALAVAFVMLGVQHIYGFVNYPTYVESPVDLLYLGLGFMLVGLFGLAVHLHFYLNNDKKEVQNNEEFNSKG